MNVKIGENEYIKIMLVERKPNTSVYGIYSKKSGEPLAQIKWHSPWRQYVFTPYENTIWNIDCLKTVRAFLQHLRTNHALKLKEVPAK